MTRDLDFKTLDQAARDYAGLFLLPETMTPSGNFLTGPGRIQQDFFNFTFKDEHDYLVERVREEFGKYSRSRFDDLAKMHFTKREDKAMHAALAAKLARSPGGDHIDGKIGTTIVDGRDCGFHTIVVEAPWSIARRRYYNTPKTPENRELIEKRVRLTWNVYAGEIEERLADSGVADLLPAGTPGMPVGATNTRVSNEAALLGANALVDNLDEGSAGATIQGRTGAQPADPDTAVSGTNLFTMTASATAFGAAADGGPGALKTANAITDDSNADATNTLGYIRCSSSNSSDTPLDDHIDGEAGTSGADWNFNTLSIVSGSTVSTTSWTTTLPET